jgi:hypothetical protein
MAVSKRLRYEILRRDSNTCRYCGAKAPDVPLRVDHVTPVALGGGDDPTNLATSCEPCNAGKSSATVDSAVVADVAEDALRWSAAMKQAANDLRAQMQPKLAYRAAFEAVWNEWTWEHGGKRKPFDLPINWKSSIDTFREAELPVEVWPDIVEKAMTNKTVRADNTFRYCCGIAWRMVRELQDRARAITGVERAQPAPVDSVVAAAVEVWLNEQFGDIDSAAREAFQASAIAARKHEDAHRIVEAGQYAAWYGESNVGAALAQLDRENALQAWQFAWLTKSGEWPSDEAMETVRKKCDALLTADVHMSRVVRAAIYAGSRQSVRLYFGLSETELAEIKESDFIAKAVEAWAEAFRASADRWPTQAEISAFFDSLQRVGSDVEGFWLVDIYQAAASAGAYQDPDMTSCLTRHLSVFEAAASPLLAA